MSGPFERIAVVGAGAWGTALAISAARAGRRVRLWARSPDAANAIERARENARRLPGAPLPEGVRVTGDLAAAVGDCEAVLYAAPTQSARELLGRLKDVRGAMPPVALCCKGVETATGALPPEILADLGPGAPGAVLSGPSFAHDLAAGRPVAVTLASADPEIGRRWIEALGHTTFRPYASDDVTGAALGGAAKNVLAIACGVVDGAELGESARAALVSRGFAELSRLALAIGAQPETLSGLSGLGDLVLTCSSRRSRNFAFGAALGGGASVEEAFQSANGVVEGAICAAALAKRAADKGVDAPICASVDAIVNGRASVSDAVIGLLSRPFKSERE